MASKLIFDPQTLIDEEKENEQKKVSLLKNLAGKHGTKLKRKKIPTRGTSGKIILCLVKCLRQINLKH